MDPRVGEARPRDALAIRALHRSVLEEGAWFVRTPDELPELSAIEAEIARYRQSENSAWFVARAHEGLVGMLTMTGGGLQRTRHVARLQVMVDKRWRSAGVGRMLLEHALDWAVSNPMLHKVSLAVFADNERAIGLYRGLGFVEEGRRIGEYLDGERARDDVLMARAV